MAASWVLFLFVLPMLTATPTASPYAAAADLSGSGSGPSPHSAYPSHYATTTTDDFSGGLSSHGATATDSFGPSPHDDSTTASFHSSNYATTATEFSGCSPRGAAATASSGPSPHGAPPAGETEEDLPSPHGALPAGETEEDLLRVLEHLMRDGAGAKRNAARMQHMANVLQLLGFLEMAAAATPASPVLAAVASWSGPVTVFAVTDQALEASCPGCSRETVLAAHVALGSFPFSQLSARPETKVPSGLPGFCFTAASASSPDDVVTLSIDGVKVISPEMFNDGGLVVHGVEGYITIPSQSSCFSSSDRVLSQTDLLRVMVALLGLGVQ